MLRSWDPLGWPLIPKSNWTGLLHPSQRPGHPEQFELSEPWSHLSDGALERGVKPGWSFKGCQWHWCCCRIWGLQRIFQGRRMFGVAEGRR